MVRCDAVEDLLLEAVLLRHLQAFGHVLADDERRDQGFTLSCGFLRPWFSTKYSGWFIFDVVVVRHHLDQQGGAAVARLCLTQRRHHHR